MILPDVNVLIYAFRADMPQHGQVRPWFDRLILGEAAFGISMLALSALVRITTNPKAFHHPSRLDEAFGFCQDILGQPHCRTIEPGDRHWPIFTRLCQESDTTGPRVSDAWFAALAIEHGCEWATLDRDYARFPGLKWSVPVGS